MPETLSSIASEIKASELIKMYPEATQTVPGDGNHSAEVMFIGEAPGKDEDTEGKPFVGRGGKLLTLMLETAGIKRENVYITNIVKCRPPENRDPTEKEKEAWYPFLEREIKALKPLLIATLGRHSMWQFLPDLSISQVHGTPITSKGIWNEHQIYLPLYHPAVGLYNPSQKQVMINDLKKIPDLVKKIKKENLYANI